MYTHLDWSSYALTLPGILLYGSLQIEVRRQNACSFNFQNPLESGPEGTCRNITETSRRARNQQQKGERQ